MGSGVRPGPDPREPASQRIAHARSVRRSYWDASGRRRFSPGWRLPRAVRAQQQAWNDSPATVINSRRGNDRQQCGQSVTKCLTQINEPFEIAPQRILPEPVRDREIKRKRNEASPISTALANRQPIGVMCQGARSSTCGAAAGCGVSWGFFFAFFIGHPLTTSQETKQAFVSGTNACFLYRIGELANRQVTCCRARCRLI